MAGFLTMLVCFIFHMGSRDHQATQNYYTGLGQEWILKSNSNWFKQLVSTHADHVQIACLCSSIYSHIDLISRLCLLMIAIYPRVIDNSYIAPLRQMVLELTCNFRIFNSN